MQESMLHCTHRHTISLTVDCTLSHFRCSAISFPLSVFLYVSLSPLPQLLSETLKYTHITPRARSLRDSWKFLRACHKSKAIISVLRTKPLFIARSDDTMDSVLPHALCGNTPSAGVSNFFSFSCVRVWLSVPPTKHLTPSKKTKQKHPRAAGRPTSVCDIQCNTTPHPHAAMSQIHGTTRNQHSVLSQKVLLLTAAAAPPYSNIQPNQQPPLSNSHPGNMDSP